MTAEDRRIRGGGWGQGICSRKGAAVSGLLLMALAGCELPFGLGPGGDPAPPEITQLPRSLSPSEVHLRDASNAFGFDLLREIVGGEPDSSHFISPLSASMALGMTLNGAEGETFQDMRNTLRFEGMSREEINDGYRGLIDLLSDLDPRVTFQVANSVWSSDRFTPLQPFVDAVRTSFDADVESVDFLDPATPSVINAWVEEKTRGRISEIVPDPLDDPEAVVMYLLNAIYFQGDWTARFDPEETRTGSFHLPDGTTEPARFMSRKGGFRLAMRPGLSVVDIPYGGKAFSMTVLLPHDPAGLPELVREMDEARWAELVGALGPEDDRARLLLPRFTLEWESSLKEVLKALGMEVAFDSRAADFSRLFGFRGPHITEVMQKTFVRVDEKGTEAAAVTSVEVGIVSAAPEVRVDRPFLFALRERLSGTILFLGVISETPLDG